MKKNKDRRKGKGRRCCVRDRIYSISCQGSYFAVGRFEEYDELHQDDLKKRMNSSFSSKLLKCKIASAATNWINSVS